MEIIKLPIYLTAKMRPKENINEHLLKRFRCIMILHFMNIIMVKSVKYVKYQDNGVTHFCTWEVPSTLPCTYDCVNYSYSLSVITGESTPHRLSKPH